VATEFGMTPTHHTRYTQCQKQLLSVLRMSITMNGNQLHMQCHVGYRLWRCECTVVPVYKLQSQVVLPMFIVHWRDV